MGAGNGNARMAEELRRLAEALSRLVREHFDLARAEIRADASRWSRDLVLGFAALPFAVLGLLLLDLALAALLARALGIPWALATIGLVNLGIAGGLGLLAWRRLREARRTAALRGTAAELKLARRALREVREEWAGNGSGRNGSQGRGLVVRTDQNEAGSLAGPGEQG